MPRKNEGTVRQVKRKDGTKVWVARYRYFDGGKQREKSKVVENKTAGYEWIAEQKAEFKEVGAVAFASKETFLEFSKWYDENYIVEAVRSDDGKITSGRKSIKPVKSQLKALQEFFGEMPLKKISYHDLERYKTHRLKTPIEYKGGTVRNRKPQTVKRELSLLSSILKKARQQKLIGKSPFDDGDALISSKVEVERTRVLSLAEQDALLKACDRVEGGKERKHLKPLILFAVNTGMRRGEILKLTWQFVDLETGVIILPEAITKSEQLRYVPIMPELLPILKEIRARAKSDDARIFDDVGDYDVKKIGDFKKAWATAKRLAKIEDLRFHDLRASFATRMLFSKKIAGDAVRKVTGHKTHRVFDRYLRPEAEDLIKLFVGESQTVTPTTDATAEKSDAAGAS
jgi:integrase